MTSRFKRWWDNNPDKAEEIRRRRRERYAENAESERRRKRKERARKSSVVKRYPRPRLFTHNGELVEAWSVGRVADYWGIHKRTNSSLESREAIPINKFIDENKRRWWPVDFVEWLKPYFDLRSSKKITPREFTKRVWNDWTSADVTKLALTNGVKDEQRRDNSPVKDQSKENG